MRWALLACNRGVYSSAAALMGNASNSSILTRAEVLT
jgi:hypothetical protein